MVEMSNSSVLVDRKPTYSKALQGTGPASLPMTKDSHRYLNGDLTFFAKQERSNSDCSTDSHELATLLEEADKIKDGENGIQKPKKRVRFNMDNNEEFSYSYANYNESSDEEIGKYGGLSNNVNYVGYEYMNGNDESDDDDDDDDDEEEEESESDENDYDTETSEDGNDHGLGKYGYLVDKSSDREVNNITRTFVNSSASKVNGSVDEGNQIRDVDNREFDSKTLGGSATNQLEKMIQSRKEAVEGEIADLTRHLVKVREETQQEMQRLQQELELRRKQYDTEIDDITRHREEQKRKFEEELEEFQNEKKLEERRQRYYEHETIINEKEQELDRRKAQVVEQEREVREYEEYLHRRHTVCNSKEGDLSVLQNELETLSRELELNKERLLNKNRGYQREMDTIDSQSTTDSLPPLNDLRTRSVSRVSTASRGVDLRIEELKSQNKQLLEELFSMKKAMQDKDEEVDNVTQTMSVLCSENKRLLQKVKNLESQLELARKSAEFHSDTPSTSAVDILHKTAMDLRNERVSRMSRVHLDPLGLTPSHIPLSRTNSGDSEKSKAKSSSSSSNSSRSARMSSKGGLKTFDDKQHTVKSGQEKTTSSLCVVM